MCLPQWLSGSIHASCPNGKTGTDPGLPPRLDETIRQVGISDAQAMCSVVSGSQPDTMTINQYAEKSVTDRQCRVQIH